jgi:hypothetical protein
VHRLAGTACVRTYRKETYRKEAAPKGSAMARLRSYALLQVTCSHPQAFIHSQPAAARPLIEALSHSPGFDPPH